MKITDARVSVCCPGRNFVTLKIETDEGLHGVGDATVNGRELAVVSYLSRPRHPLPDRSRRAPDRRHLALPLSRALTGGAVPSRCVQSPLSTRRCWDIKAKAAGLPLVPAARR